MLDQMLAPIDIYCERGGHHFWAEPVNALTNLAFVVAGLWGVRAVRRHEAGQFAEMLAWWVVAIGIGSGLFHTFANRLTMLADVIPIASLTLVFTWFVLRRYLAMERLPSLAVLTAFCAVAGLATAAVPDWLRVASNGSTGYLPAFLALVFFGGWLARVGHAAAPHTLGAAAIFVVSVAFRAADQVVCDAFPLGTHFMWHLLNALMLGVLLAGVARHGAPRRKTAPA